MPFLWVGLLVFVVAWAVAPPSSVAADGDGDHAAGAPIVGNNGANLAGAQFGGVWTTNSGAELNQPNVIGASASLIVPRAWGPGWVTPWVGIGDGPGPGLVQEGVGTRQGHSWFAWYAVCSSDTAPGTIVDGVGCSQVQVGGPVQVGDLVAMLTARVGPCAWKMAMTDYTTHWAWSMVWRHYCIPNAAHTADWVVEGGSEGLALMHFSHLQFNAVRYEVAGAAWTSARFNDAQAIYMNNMGPGSQAITVCADGRPWRNWVVVKWLHACGAG